MLGGPNGREVTVSAGDVAVLPAGIGHCWLRASDFLVVGGYPPRQKPDMCRQAATPEMIARIARLPLPTADPVAGPLVAFWQAG